MIRKTLVTSVLLLAANQASALNITVDSQLGDWLANTPSGLASDWTPKSSTDPQDEIKWFVEDQNTSYLNPGYGGQAYDAEAIYVNRSNTHINIAIVTGMAPNANYEWPAGDIAIDFGFDHNNPMVRSFEIGIVTVNDNFGIGAAPGRLYSVTEWNYGLWEGPNDTGNAATAYKLAHPTTVKDGTAVGSVDFSYSATPITNLGDKGGNHYVIEAAIPWTLLDSIDSNFRNQSFLVHWTMACANDFVEVDPPAGAVPTPAPLALVLLGLLPLLRRGLRG